MAYSNVGTTPVGVNASADLSAHLNKFVVLDSSAEVALAGAGVHVLGVLQNKPDAQGKPCAVWGTGSTVKVIAGASVSAGANVASNAAGLAIAATSGAYIAGVAQNAAASGELVTLFLNQPGRLA